MVVDLNCTLVGKVQDETSFSCMAHPGEGSTHLGSQREESMRGKEIRWVRDGAKVRKRKIFGARVIV